MVPEEITLPFVVVCEGPADEAFLSHLSRARKIGGLHFAFPEREKDEKGEYYGAGGKNHLFRSLNALIPLRGFEENLKGVLMVVDSDSCLSN